MKARTNSKLACGHVPAIGDLIVSRGQGWRQRWVCGRCALDDLGAGKVKISTEGKRT